MLAAVYRSAAIGETLPAILAGFMLAIIAVMNVNIAAPIKINGEKDTFVPTSEFAEYIIFKNREQRQRKQLRRATGQSEYQYKRFLLPVYKLFS